MTARERVVGLEAAKPRVLTSVAAALGITMIPIATVMGSTMPKETKRISRGSRGMTAVRWSPPSGMLAARS